MAEQFLSDDLGFLVSSVQTMSPIDVYLKSDKGQIDIRGLVIEPGWEYFVPSVAIYEDGHLLYTRDAQNVDSYHNESYTSGRFESEEAAVDYLKEKYQNVVFEKTDTPHPYVQEHHDIRWENKAYAREQQMTPAEKEDSLTRIVFKDRGMDKNYHRVDFAYACDKKTFGEDTSIPNPYLMSSKRKDAQGKLENVHSYFLSDAIYNRLMSFANTDGMSSGRWSGVVAAQVGYPTSRNGKSKISVNLTDDAEKKGLIMTPREPFDESKHDAFIKASLAERSKNRKAQLSATVIGNVEEKQTEQPTLNADICE